MEVDLEELPEKLRDHDGPLTISGTDQDGTVWERQVTVEQLEAAMANWTPCKAGRAS